MWIINAVAATVRKDVIKMLAIRQDIAEIRPDSSTVTLSDPLPAATADPEWNIGYISAPELWDLGFTGQDVVVANMDTGVDVTHDDLASRWRGGLNSWFDPNGEHVAGPFDLNGHGTRTMGIMVGGDATGAAIGVAPGAKWIAVKIFDDSGAAPLSGIHQGFQWLLDPDGNPLTDDAPVCRQQFLGISGPGRQLFSGISAGYRGVEIIRNCRGVFGGQRRSRIGHQHQSRQQSGQLCRRLGRYKQEHCRYEQSGALRLYSGR